MGPKNRMFLTLTDCVRIMRFVILRLISDFVNGFVYSSVSFQGAGAWVGCANRMTLSRT